MVLTQRSMRRKHHFSGEKPSFGDFCQWQGLENHRHPEGWCPSLTDLSILQNSPTVWALLFIIYLFISNEKDCVCDA